MASELVGAPVIKALLTHLVPIVSEQVYRVWDVKNELQQLQNKLESIQGVLTDAENQQVDRENIKRWLRDLKDIAYEAHDILDKYAYESLRTEIKTRKWEKLQNFFSSSNFMALRYSIDRKLRKLNQKLVQIDDTKNMFHLSRNIGEVSTSGTTVRNIQTGRETFSYVTSEIVGRERAASDVINLLISNNEEKSSIICIIGMGGVGKTALAQIVYNSDAVMRQFKEKMWVCVSQHSNQKRILNQLLESLFNLRCDEFLSLDVIVKNLKKKLHKKRYLVVLDDMWNDKGNLWEEMLQTLLHIGAPGSKVIVTTRSNEVIASTTSSLSSYNLAGLSYEESWVLLAKIAFGPGGAQKPPNLTAIGKRIARKCGGVPLAIKVLGGLMYKKRSLEEWQSIESNVIWEYKEGEEKIINVLKLSYDYLEPDLKRCFAFCSLFPKDHILKKKTLIQLWMAEGFLSSITPNTELEVGDLYFNTLLRNSFFHDEKENDVGNIKSCKMHCLMHDLAQFLAQNECLIMNVNQIPREKLSSLRRISWFTDQNTLLLFPELFSDERKKLRAFICNSTEFVDNAYAMGQIFNNFSHLRVLDLSYYPIDELPSAIENLKYLRYLNLSNSRLTKLPNSITTLYNLQVLILKNCLKLKVLPRDMSKLKNLRHLIICTSKCMTDEWIPPMPRNIGKLINLRYLPVFTVGNKFQELEELGTLTLLGSKLRIHNLEYVSTTEIAERARLGDKQFILWLELHWTILGSCVRDNLEEVLQGLQPHPSLKKLGIYNYAGLKFSTWMMDLNNLLPNLTIIVLENCTRCETLPPLGLLPFLKVLNIVGFRALERIGREFFVGNSSSVSSFPCLEDLLLYHMDNLEEWTDHISKKFTLSFMASSSSSSSFPSLKKLRVKFCPKLRIMPTRISSLKELEIGFCLGEAETVSSLVISNLKSLTSVSITKCEELVFLPSRLLKRNNILESLLVTKCLNFEGFNEDQNSIMEEEDVEGYNIIQDREEEDTLHSLLLENCPALISLPTISGFNDLAGISLLSCKILKSLPSGIENLPRLRSLSLGDFSEELDSFPFSVANIVDERIVGDYFPSLVYLCIKGWSKLNCLPDQIQHIASLQTLDICAFNSLVVLPEWLGNLTSLKELNLHDCCDLEYMPSEEQMIRLASLQKLEIEDCPLLADRCKEGGVEHYKISNINDLWIF